MTNSIDLRDLLRSVFQIIMQMGLKRGETSAFDSLNHRYQSQTGFPDEINLNLKEFYSLFEIIH